MPTRDVSHSYQKSDADGVQVVCRIWVFLKLFLWVLYALLKILSWKVLL